MTERNNRLPWTIVSLILMATIIDGMDTTIVNIILPDMSRELGMSVSSSAFIVVSYLIPIAGFCLFFGKLADRVDIRRFFILGTVIFMVSSLACGLSFDPISILLSRFVQGLGAAFMVASTPIMVVRLLPDDTRGRGMGVIALGTGLSSILGAPLGGFIEEMSSWHWVFLINIPLCIALILLSHRILPKGKPSDVTTVMPDPKAVVTMFMGMGLLIAILYLYIDGLIQPIVTVSGLVLSIVLLASTVFLSARSDRPLVDIRLVRNRRFVTVSVVFLLSTLMGAGVIYLLPFYFETVEGWGTALTSIVMAVSSVMAVLLATPTGKWCDSRGCRVPATLSLALRALFCLGFAFMVPSLGIWYVMVFMVVMGLSFGISGTSQSTRMVVEADEGLDGDAGVMAMLVNYVGYALGLALFATVFSSLVPGSMATDPDLFLGGFHWSMVLAMVIALAAMVMSMLVRENLKKET